MAAGLDLDNLKYRVCMKSVAFEATTGKNSYSILGISKEESIYETESYRTCFYFGSEWLYEWVGNRDDRWI
jgi:hypothetical protein